jgi:DNA-binding response OmpR family regulator
MAWKILIAEDDEAIGSLLALVLSDNGYEVRVAGDGHQALLLIAAEAPDILLTDLGMPRVSGSALISEVRREGHTFPVLVMTAGQRAETEAARLGVQGFISKPFSIDDVVAAIRALLPAS